MATPGIKKRLEDQGSLLTAFDGDTPPPAIFPDPLNSSNSELSAYKGITPRGYLDNLPE